MEHRTRIRARMQISFLILVVFSTVHLSAQECDKKLDDWNKKSTFPAGVADAYVDCVDKVEIGLTELEAQIKRLQTLRNAQIITLETSFEKLEKYYVDEEQDDIGDEFKARKRTFSKTHKKAKI